MPLPPDGGVQDEEQPAIDEPVGVTETVAPVGLRSDDRGGLRRWMTEDDVALLLATPPHSAMPLVGRLGTHVDARDEHGWTLLMHGALWGLPAVVAELLEAGADVGCQSTMLKHCKNRDGEFEFPRGSTALSIANMCVDEECAEDSDAFLVVTMLRCPSRHVGVAPDQLSRRTASAVAAVDSAHAWDPQDDPPPLASSYSWLPASALPAHYHQTSMQPSESADEAALREFREAVVDSAALRASGDFSSALDGYKAAVRKYAGASLQDGQYASPEPETSTSSGSFAIKRQSWDVANQQRTIEWQIS